MMWPPVLDMTRDECRGVLRRLELETYSNVVSTFRAQGGLSEVKIKLLEELRNVFHISTDRHRAEARRVANDEQLCTIAENISGPNTTQEWSREGRRLFPLLSRAAPYTALSAVANGVADIAKHENAKLPYPSETSRVTKHNETEFVPDSKIVKQDPTLLTADERRNLKRQAHPITDSATSTSPISKKRTISGSGSGSGENAQQSQLQLHTNTKIQQLYHSHSKTQSRHKKGGAQKRTSSGSMKGVAKGSGIGSQNATKVQPVVPKTPKTPDTPSMPVNKNNLPIPRNLHTYASMLQPNAQYESFTNNEKSGKLIVDVPESAPLSNWPQIATSKKDITNNLSKLNMMSNSQMHANSSPIIGDSGKIETPIHPSIFTTDGRPLANNVASPIQIPWVPKTQTSVVAGQRSAKAPAQSNVTGLKPNNNNNKQLLQSQYQPSPNSSAISLASGYININQKVVKPEGASIISLNERKEIDLANANVVAATAFVRQESIPIVDGSNIKPTTIIGSGNFDLKTNTEGSPSTNSGAKPKIQIHSNQTISPAYGSIKLATGVQLKGIARKTVQIFSSPSGKMFIQSADGTKSQLGATTASGTSTTTPNRYALQKVQIVPSTSATPIKPISFTKSDMILMPGSVLSTTPNSGNVVVRSIPMLKQTKSLPTQIINKSILSESNSSGLVKNQNVIVIGAVSTEKNAKEGGSKNMNEGNMITEDTPVDILTTPLSNVDNTIHMTTTTASKDGPTKFEIKSPITVLQTITSPIKEDANKRIVIQDDQAGRFAGSHKLRQQPIAVAELHTPIHKNIKAVDTGNNYIVSSTDWEVELDQHAANNRNNQAVIIQDPPKQHMHSDDASNAMVVADIEDEDECKDENDTSQQIIDNFNDVIEEDTIYEESIINEATEGEDDVEFDVSYGSVQEEIDDNVEYVDTSSDVMIDEYGEVLKSDTDDNDRSHIAAKTIPARQAQTITYSVNNTDNATKGKVVQSSESSSSSSVIYEIEENGMNQVNR